jgi:hypothetical protein
MTEPRYTRLTRSRARTAFGIISTARSSLWLGDDHVLLIDTSGFTESYKRFYFRDIQAFVLRGTTRWIHWGIAWGVFASLCIAWAFLLSEARYLFAALAAGFLLVLALHLAAGPSCVCHLRTAVQTEELPSLNRVRRARKILARLRQLIEGVQGQLAPEEFAAQLREAPAPASHIASELGSATVTGEDPNVPPRIV